MHTSAGPDRTLNLEPRFVEVTHGGEANYGTQLSWQKLRAMTVASSPYIRQCTPDYEGPRDEWGLYV